MYVCACMHTSTDLYYCTYVYDLFFRIFSMYRIRKEKLFTNNNKIRRIVSFISFFESVRNCGDILRGKNALN
jgi:hypothetical protein